MIIKSFEINKVNLTLNNLFLFYGKNEGFKNEVTKNILMNKKNILNYEEKEILENEDNFVENLLTKSLFNEEKIIVVKRTTDKMMKVIEEIAKKNIEDIKIILNADVLEKKSKLRSFFEKDKTLVCVPFYPDNDQTLSKVAYSFLRDKKISISPSNVNLIINKCSGDREILLNELQKMEFFNKNGKKIDNENISKLVNLNENHNISELIDNCLAKNKKK